MKFMCDKMKEGLQNEKEYVRDEDITMKLVDNRLCFFEKKIELSDSVTLSDITADWQEVTDYLLSFLEALDEMRKDPSVKCVCDVGIGEYYFLKDEILMFEIGGTIRDPMVDFNLLSKAKWKVVK